MITSIRSITFSQNRNKIDNQKQKNYLSNLYNTPCDSVSFSGKQITSKLSKESVDLVQNFAKKLKLNKVYKFDNPNVERFQMTSIATPQEPTSKENMTKHVMCLIKDTGEIIENGIPVKNPKEIEIYEQVLTAIINHASKELKVKLN